MTKKETFSLGGRPFEVGPLTMGQMREVGVASMSMKRPDAQSGVAPETAERNWYDGVFRLISIVTGLPVGEIEGIEGASFTELLEAVTTIYRVSGLVVETPDNKDGGAPTGPKGELAAA